MTRKKACSVCEAEFVYEVKRGCERRTVCSDACRKVREQVHRKSAKAAITLTCRIEGCTRVATRRMVGLCEGCYCRIRRNGDASWRIRQGVRKPLRHAGYVYISSPDHPLVGKSGMAGEHRLLLYDKLGSGPQTCYWCASQVTWSGDNPLVVDHLNDVKHDNRPENLVPSCNGCNRARGWMMPFAARLHPAALEHLILLMREMRVAQGQTA